MTHRFANTCAFMIGALMIGWIGINFGTNPPECNGQRDCAELSRTRGNVR